MSTQDLLFSEEFSAYRKLEIAEAVKIIADIFNDTLDPAYIKGALAMLKKILFLPRSMAHSEEAQELASLNIERDLKEFEVKFLRRVIEE